MAREEEKEEKCSFSTAPLFAPLFQKSSPDYFCGRERRKEKRRRRNLEQWKRHKFTRGKEEMWGEKERERGGEKETPSILSQERRRGRGRADSLHFTPPKEGGRGECFLGEK